MLDALVAAFSIVIQPQSLFLIFVGTMIGITLGAIPGLGGVVTLSLLLPISLIFDSTAALIFLISSLGGLNFGGSIPAILLNVPGTAPSVMTTLDGFAMSKDNRAAEAIGASATASAMGAVIGFGFLLAIIPVVRQVLMFFGPPEFLLVSVIGALSIAYVLKGSLLNGLIATLIGVTLGFHGFNQVTGVLRFGFDVLYLFDGIPLVVVVIGLFAIGEMIKLGMERETISEDPGSVWGNPMSGVRATFSNLSTVVKSAAIGIGIGLIPAVGATVSTLIAYVNASKSDPDSFGHGNVLGVIAPEASNDAKDSSSLIPTLSFGIPGSPSHAVLLGGLMIHGLTPGPGLFNDHFVTILAIIIALLISNILTSSIGLSTSRYLVRISSIPLSIIIPVVTVLSLYGVYAFRGNPIDILILVPLGLFGYLAARYEVSRVALLFGLILGPIIESTYHQTIQIAAGDPMAIISRPVFLVIVVVAGAAALVVIARGGLAQHASP